MKATELTTKELAVAGVEVVKTSSGNPKYGPFYLDQLELLRDTLRGMQRRHLFEVAPGDVGFWIFRKPSEAQQ